MITVMSTPPEACLLKGSPHALTSTQTANHHGLALEAKDGTGHIARHACYGGRVRQEWVGVCVRAVVCVCVCVWGGLTPSSPRMRLSPMVLLSRHRLPLPEWIRLCRSAFNALTSTLGLQMERGANIVESANKSLGL